MTNTEPVATPGPCQGAAMSLADELWEKYSEGVMTKALFFSALTEAIQAVRKRDAELCQEHATIEGIAQKCAAAIEREPLP